jgi:hypothetical protein
MHENRPCCVKVVSYILRVGAALTPGKTGGGEIAEDAALAGVEGARVVAYPETVELIPLTAGLTETRLDS